MTRCPRCHSSMLMDYTDSLEGFRRTLKCIGCGREILRDNHEQVEEERMVERIRQGILSA